MAEPLTITNDTLVMANMGVIGGVAITYGKIIYKWAVAEMKAQHMEKSLNSAHEKIREIEKELKELGKD